MAHCARLGGSYFRGVRGRDCHRHAAGMGENEVGELMALRPFVAAGSDTMTFTVCRAKRRNGCGSGHLRPIQEVCIGAWFQAHCCHPVRRKHGLVKAAVDIVIGVDVEQQIHVFVIDRLSQVATRNSARAGHKHTRGILHHCRQNPSSAWLWVRVS